MNNARLSIYDFIHPDGVLRVPPEYAVWPSLLRISDRPDLTAIEGLREVPVALHLHYLPNLRGFGSIEVVHGPINVVDCGNLRDIGALRMSYGAANFSGTAIFEAPHGFETRPDPSHHMSRLILATRRQAFPGFTA